MSLLDIKKYPETVLKERCAEVKEIDEEILSLIDNMIGSGCRACRYAGRRIKEGYCSRSFCG